MEQAIRICMWHIHKTREEFENRRNRITPKTFSLHETILYKSENPTGPERQPSQWMDKYAEKATIDNIMNYDQYKIRSHKTGRIF